jgi:SAM-dependent methyltransferase
MSHAAKRPLLLPAPLQSTSSLVDLLAECTSQPRQMVLACLIEEVRHSGANVQREARQFGLEPHVWSEQLIRFYRETTAFLFEGAVWNRSTLKQATRRWLGDFVKNAIPTGSRVLVYGDGLGFDAAFLASLGYDVTSLEPSNCGRRFAAEVFNRNRVTVRQAADEMELSGEMFHAIVCLDVLEHVLSPPDTLAAFQCWLDPGGVLVVSAPFFAIEPDRPTHLRSNRKYSGDLRLFRDAGFAPVAGRGFWDPIAFRKGQRASLRQTALLRLGQPVLMSGRWLWPLHCRVARWMLKADQIWLSELRQLQQTG